MQKEDVIVVTGAAGFIGSYMVGYLNALGYHQLILVDDFSKAAKDANTQHKSFLAKIDRADFFSWAASMPGYVKYIIHLGARTDTTEMDYAIHKELNLDYSKQIWTLCAAENIPLIYASSAATYGEGEHGYTDSHDIVNQLQPLNPYGRSKNEFDIWALQQTTTPPFWAGLKFFNVYGPNEYHKGRMASVIYHAFNQIKSTGSVNLFRSHRPDFNDGEQMRDFIYVDDVASIILWLAQNKPESGLYNTGTGKARSFNDLVNAIFNELGITPQILYVDTPADIRDKYQYFTEANMNKLQQAGYTAPFNSLEDGVGKYVNGYLKKGSYF